MAGFFGNSKVGIFGTDGSLIGCSESEGIVDIEIITGWFKMISIDFRINDRYRVSTHSFTINLVVPISKVPFSNERGDRTLIQVSKLGRINSFSNKERVSCHIWI